MLVYKFESVFGVRAKKEMETQHVLEEESLIFCPMTVSVRRRLMFTSEQMFHIKQDLAQDWTPCGICPGSAKALSSTHI